MLELARKAEEEVEGVDLLEGFDGFHGHFELEGFAGLAVEVRAVGVC